MKVATILIGLTAALRFSHALPWTPSRPLKKSLPSFGTKTQKKRATSATLASLRGGGAIPVSSKELATFYSLLYLFHSMVMQYTPSGMANFYGSVDQGSFHDVMYSSAANSQMGLGVLIYLCAVTSREAGRSIGWSFLPYLADAFPLLYYSSTQATAAPANKSSPASEGPFNINQLTIWSLIFGGSSFLILLGSCPAAARLPAYLATIVGVVGALFPTEFCSNFEGPKIDGNGKQ